MNPEAGTFIKEHKDYVYWIEHESQQGASLIKDSLFSLIYFTKYGNPRSRTDATIKRQP